MKKRLLILSTALIVCSLILLAFTSCGKCEHAYESAITTPPSCTEEGTMTYTCKECGDSYTEAIEVLAHDYSLEDVLTEPTCTEEGTTTHTCKDCGASYTTPITALGHSFSTEWESDGTHHYYVCTCGEKSQESEHTSSGDASADVDEVCTVCNYVITPAVGIKFGTLTSNDGAASFTVSNNTTTYSFADEITCVGKATFIVSENESVDGNLNSQTVELQSGDNTFYIIVLIDNTPSEIFTVVIHRKSLFEVSFVTNGGTAIETMYVEEGETLSPPTTTLEGYTFLAWDFDFSNPITESITVTASWSANTDTAYTVEYYVKNLDGDGYTLHKSESLSGTTGTEVTISPIDIPHFIYNDFESVTKGTIQGDGKLVLVIYYIRESYSISNKNANVASINLNGTYAYGSSVELSVLSTFLGYRFLGWYSGDTLLCAETTFSLILEMDVEARFEMCEEMSAFSFTSTETSCTITSFKNKGATEIVVPDYVTSIAQGAFASCASLESITLPFVGGNKNATVASASTLFGYIFGSSKYTGGTETSQTYADSGYAKYYIPTSLKSVTVTGGTLHYGAFYGCDNITTVVLGGCVLSIGKYAFTSCDGLVNLTIENGATSIGERAFSHCRALVNITIPDSVLTIGEKAFNECTVLNYITIGRGVMSIGTDAFLNCSALTAVNIKSIANWCQIAFADSESNPLSYAHILHLNGNVVYGLTIPSGVTSISDRAFLFCESITSVSIPSTVTYIGISAFYSCKGLTTVKIPDSVTSMGSWVFAYCTNLNKVTLGSGLTAIPESTFATCRNLATVIIGKNVTSIGSRAFFDCGGLMSIKFRGTSAQWSSISKGSNWNYLATKYTVSYNYTGT